MTLTQFGPAYSKCTFTELKRSIRNRGIEAQIHNRRQVIRVLRESDREATFRFFDLHPELRNQVYRDVLEVNTSTGVGNSIRRSPTQQSILATCKQAYNEASGLLYSDYHFPLRIYFGQNWMRLWSHVGATFHGNGLYRSLPLSDDSEALIRGWDLLKPKVEWPAVFARIQCLDLEVDIGKKNDNPSIMVERQGAVLVNDMLHELQLLLCDMKNLRSIRIKVSSYNAILDAPLQKVLSPLMGIASHFKRSSFEFVNVGQTIQLYLHEAVTVFRTVQSINDEVIEAYDRWLRSIEDEEEEDEEEEEVEEEVRNADAQRASVSGNDPVGLPMEVYMHDVLLDDQISKCERWLKELEVEGGEADDWRSALRHGLMQLKVCQDSLRECEARRLN